MFNLWFELGFGLVIITVLLGLAVISKGNLRKIKEDSDVIKIIEKELGLDGVEHFELESIVSLDSGVTHVVVSTGHLQIAIEIDSSSGEILNKERIARQ